MRSRHLWTRILGLLFSLIFIMPHSTYALNNASPIPAEQAFRLDAKLNDTQTLTLHWQIAKGYHLYRDHFYIARLSPQKKVLQPVSWPNALQLPIEALNNPLVYSGQLNLIFKLPSVNGIQTIAINYQGCSDSGFCYPPFQQTVTINNRATPTMTLSDPTPLTAEPSATKPAFWIPNLNQTHVIWALLGFYALGLLLAFTPCVLPMLPILASIIVGQTHAKDKHRGKAALALSLTYVLAMAATYAAAGLILAWLGANVQAWLQQTWLLLAFGVLLIILALAQWELFQIKLPQTWEHRLHQLHHRRRGGSYTEVALMGIIATLIVSPCVTPPLIATLAYISQVGNFVLGGSALFILALGMGTPLILVGTFEGFLLPKAGPWLEDIKIVLGLLLFIVAGLVLDRLLTPMLSMLWWSAVAWLLAWKLVSASSRAQGKTRKILAIIIAAYGVLLCLGVIFQKPSWLGPWGNTAPKPSLTFIKITSLNDLAQQQIQAKLLHQPILLDFYAKWCLSCQLLDKTTFTNPQVLSSLSSYRLLRVDMTKSTPAIKAILETYQIYAPPQIILFNADGQKQAPPLVGEITAKQLLNAISQKSTYLCTNQSLFPSAHCSI